MKINSLSISFLTVFILNFILGVFVYVRGKKKLSNKIYSIFSIQLAFWAFISFLISTVNDIKIAIFLIRIVFAYASFVPPTFYLFAVSIGEEFFPKKEIGKIVGFYLLGVFNTIIAFFPTFIIEGFFSYSQGIRSGPMIKYGKIPMSLFSLNIIITLTAGLINLYKKKREKSGIVALEIFYVFLGVLLATLFEVFIIFLPILFEVSAADRLGCFASVFMSGIIIYGIGKYKIMDLSFVYEIIILYSILSITLFVIYLFSFYALNFLIYFFGFSPGFWSTFLSAFIVAMSFSPLREILKKYLRVKVLKYDIEVFINKIFEILFSLSSTKEIFKNLTEKLSEFLNIPTDILFLLKERKDFPFEKEDLPENINVVFEKDSLFFDVLKKAKIIIKEEEKRFEMIYPEKKKIVKEFEKYGYDVAVGIEEKGEIKGVIFLKEKLDKRVFSYRDQLLLINLGYMIGLSIENIKLYHQISEINIYIKNLLDNSPFGVVSFDKNGNITLFNAQMERFFNIKEEEILGTNFKNFLPLSIVPLVEKKLYTFERDIIEKEIEMKIDDKTYIFRTIIVPLFENDKLLGVQVIFSDLSKVKQLEEEIKRKEKLASLGIMAAGLAHEIKNPLVAIKTFADLFPFKYNDPEFRNLYANVLKEEIERINNLIEQVLIFARPQITRIENVNLNEIIDSTISLLNLQFSTDHVKIIKKLPKKDVIIKGDREKLKQVFLNIILNSYDAVRNKENGLIEIEMIENQSNVKICINDNGCGIKKEIMNKIFDPFFTTKEKGTGLGLSIVLRIVEEHKGKIKVESEENKGTKVYVELPKEEKFFNEMHRDSE